MKTVYAFRFGFLLFMSSLVVNAREAALRYKFAAGQTNVFAVEISVRSETGSEITTGNVI
jgi:hypothetical protein